MDATIRDPDAMDEGYWKALLNEGEVARMVPQEVEGGWQVDGRPAGEGAGVGGGVGSEDPWARGATALQSGEIGTARVVGYNRGGLLVDWNSLRGFVPASHLVGLSPSMDEEARKAEFARRIGWNLCVKVIEVDQGHG